MALRKFVPSSEAPSVNMKALNFSGTMHEDTRFVDPETSLATEPEVDIDLREVYFLIMHFLSAGPCRRTYGQFWNELLEHQLLPRRYHAWYSRNGARSGDDNDDGMSLPLSYNMLVERYSHVEKDHLVKLLKQLILSTAPPSRGMSCGNAPNAADVPTLLGTGSFSLLSCERDKVDSEIRQPPAYMRWPHMKADQVHGLSLREIGGGFSRHHRAPSIRAASYAIAKPSTMVQKMQNIKRLRGHRNAVYCAIFDRTGRHVITGSDDRLVKIWSMETAYCLASCRGHEGDITDLAVSSNNAVVASSSNDCIIRVWRLPDGQPISVLRGHTGAVTAIAFSPRPGFVYQLLSSSDDGTCRIWDARYSQLSPRLYVPRPLDNVAGRNNGPSSSTGVQNHQIFCCAFNSSGTVFVTGSSDTLARVWSASKTSPNDSDQPNHEIDVLSGHENDVNYVQFSGHAVTSRFMTSDVLKEDIPKFKNSWFTHDNIVTCSRDGSAIIWIPRSRRSHVKACRWTRAYHLKVPPPPMPPQPPRGGPRQRILPTPRGVNMIIWSLDNRFVLAAIMDCRICVWNASDGSLVHSLTGHTESTYVLDVHPFNPRIAMSAGYDGRTIVWDIWEGKPIRIYEMSRFKLVDGKFSPDGTSIILSDDVGQLYVLNTGQGESQKDAKYDQFFLGDYRPLIQDTCGNVLDQETQITPFRRNMQDLLCDSAMIPYPEPYQSEYQRRRLGALGLEWKPTSLKLATGPDFTLDPDFQIIPLADLDILAEPLPDFLDVMDWEPEIEMHSDDNDSEYNVPEGYSTGGEQGTLSSNSSDDSECSAEDGETEDAQLDRLRRSKRKKRKAETEVMTSSGRRVKRRNFDEGDGNQLKNHRTTKSKSGRKASRKKSSSSKSLRPQRAAARNALTLFSKITGTSTDGEDEEGSGVDTSESESTLQDSNIESDGSDKYLQDDREKHMKGKEILVDESEEFVKHQKVPVSHMNSGIRTRLVLRLPMRESNKLVFRENIVSERDEQADLVGPSSNFPREMIAINGKSINSQDSLESPGGDAKRSSMGGLEEAVLDKIDRFSLPGGYKNGTIRWGGVKARSSKRLRLGEATPSNALSRTNLRLEDRFEKDNNVGGFAKTEMDSAPDVQIRKHVVGADGVVMTDGGTVGDHTCSMANGLEHSPSTKFGNDEKSKSPDMATCNETAFSVNDENRANIQLEQTDNPPVSSTKLRLKMISEDPESPRSQETKSVAGNLENGRCETLHDKPLEMEENSVVPKDKPTNRIKSVHGDGALESGTHCDKNAEFSVKDSTESLLRKDREKMYIAVYKRSRSHKGKTAVVGDIDGKEGSTSNVSNNNLSVGEDSIDQSNGLKASTCSPNVAAANVKLDQGLESGHKLRNIQNGSRSRHQVPHEEWGSSSRMTVGLRSTRNRRGSYHAHETSPIHVRKSNKPAKKGTWLMLTAHEGGFRYIPQLGDEVAYLRQGHQEYLEHNRLREHPPWTSIKGDIRDVELCKVQKLDYSSLPGSGESCCKMMLEFVDPASSVYGRSFKMTLPEMTGFPDFLVERTRYDAAMQRNWTRRDKCKVWWSDDSEEDGNWWVGRIMSVQAKSNEFPDSPWESCTVQYKTDPPETHLHSPWELFEINEPWEHPHIDEESKENLMAAFAKLEKSSKPPQDRYGINHLKQLSQRTNFTNRFPVPISFEVIECRLENNYYRSLEAMKHDFEIMLLNAEQYLGNKPEFLVKLKRLSEWLTRMFSSL